MKVYMTVDMEGITGIVDWKQTAIGEKEYEEGRKLMTGDVNAAIEGALAAGATEILVNDAHHRKRNVILRDLNPIAQLIRGEPKAMDMMQGVDEDCDVAMCIGYHAMAGSADAICNHTWNPIVFEVQLNGRPIGELGLDAALAGYYGVPIVMVSGDETFVEQAHALLGDIEAVAVKKAYGMHSARCLHPDKSAELISAAAKRAVAKGGKPYIPSPPLTVKVTFATAQCCDRAAILPGSRRLDGRTLEYTAEDAPTMYGGWRSMVDLARAQG
jgi:D-amino peptidase